MFSQEQLTIDYIADNKRFILSKTDLRCIDQKNEANTFTVPLNKLDPNYNFHYYFNPIMLVVSLLFSSLLFTRFILDTVHDISFIAVQKHYISSDARQAAVIVLAFFSIIAFAYFLMRSYQTRKSSQGYRFSYAGESEIAVIIPELKKDAAKTEIFLQTLTQRINDAAPSNETILYFLEQYHLLTRVEWAQLDANLVKKHEININRPSNIIHFPNKKA